MTDQELAEKLFPYLRYIVTPAPAFLDVQQWRHITEQIIERIRFHEIKNKPWPPAPISDEGEIADIARKIASYCDGPTRERVYKRAKQEIALLRADKP